MTKGPNYDVVILMYLFHATVLFLTPLKTSENQKYSYVFRAYGKRLARNVFMYKIYTLQIMVISKIFINPFHATDLFLYHVKTEPLVI